MWFRLSLPTELGARKKKSILLHSSTVHTRKKKYKTNLGTYDLFLRTLKRKCKGVENYDNKNHSSHSTPFRRLNHDSTSATCRRLLFILSIFSASFADFHVLAPRFSSDMRKIVKPRFDHIAKKMWSRGRVNWKFKPNLVAESNSFRLPYWRSDFRAIHHLSPTCCVSACMRLNDEEMKNAWYQVSPPPMRRSWADKLEFQIESHPRRVLGRHWFSRLWSPDSISRRQRFS